MKLVGGIGCSLGFQKYRVLVFATVEVINGENPAANPTFVFERWVVDLPRKIKSVVVFDTALVAFGIVGVGFPLETHKAVGDGVGAACPVGECQRKAVVFVLTEIERHVHVVRTVEVGRIPFAIVDTFGEARAFVHQIKYP